MVEQGGESSHSIRVSGSNGRVDASRTGNIMLGLVQPQLLETPDCSGTPAKHRTLWNLPSWDHCEAEEQDHHWQGLVPRPCLTHAAAAMLRQRQPTKLYVYVHIFAFLHTHLAPTESSWIASTCIDPANKRPHQRGESCVQTQPADVRGSSKQAVCADRTWTELQWPET